MTKSRQLSKVEMLLSPGEVFIMQPVRQDSGSLRRSELWDETQRVVPLIVSNRVSQHQVTQRFSLVNADSMEDGNHRMVAIDSMIKEIVENSICLNYVNHPVDNTGLL